MLVLEISPYDVLLIAYSDITRFSIIGYVMASPVDRLVR